MIQVWGRANSVNVQKVVWACVEAGLDFERTDAGGAFGLVDEPWYLELNPNGRIPVIDDDGFVLWESNVIVRYLASKSPGAELCPQDAERTVIKRGLVQAHAQESAEQEVILQLLAELPVAADGMQPDQQSALQERLRGN